MKAKRKRAATAFNAALSQAPASPLSRNSNLDGRTEYREDAQRSKFSDREMFGSHSGHAEHNVYFSSRCVGDK